MIWSTFAGSSDEWDSVILQLNATSPFATAGWARFKGDSRWTVLRGIRREEGRVVSAVQVFWVNILGLFTIAWVPGGVIGSLESASSELLRFVSSNSKKRIVYCRVSLHCPDDKMSASTLSENNWVRTHRYIGARETFVLTRAKEKLADRSILSSNWRRNLDRGLKHGQQTSIWKNPNPEEIHTLFQQMVDFKRSLGPSEIPSIDYLSSLIESIGDELVVVQTRNHTGQLLAIRAAIRTGKFAWDTLAASNELARKNYSSYVCAWHLIEVLDGLEVQQYDLAGVDPVHNTGVFNFKKGIGGQLVRYLGEWDIATNGPTRLIARTLISRLM